MTTREQMAAAAQPVFGDVTLLDRLFRMARPPIVRTMLEFAEQEIVVPDGPYAGEHYSADRQPYARLWFNEIDLGRWRRHSATGPTQTGKTLTCFTIPILYHLFEMGENVVVGIPDLDMMEDKWKIDLKPIIERSNYADLLPTSGAGSKGGVGTLVQFRNGAALRFMTGGAGDKGRAHFTSRVVVITETDGMDTSGEASKETDPISQLEVRARSYGDSARIYMECTLTTERGRTYREIKDGSDSRIVLPCPVCKQGVSPEREHLVGWNEARTIKEARDKAEFCCPACGAVWTEEQRARANAKATLVHDNPRAEEGTTFGFRWSAVHNLFMTAADIGEDEFNALAAEDEENAEKEMCQFVWALPYIAPEMDVTPLDEKAILARGDTSAGTVKGIVPAWAELITLGIDLGKRFADYVVLAWQKNGTCRAIDYGTFEINSDDHGVERATLMALRDFRDNRVAIGWAKGAVNMMPSLVLIDCNYAASKESVYQFCMEQKIHKVFHPARGFGNWHDRKTYADPSQPGRTKRGLAEHYHKHRLANRLWEIQMDANYWKSFVHERLKTPQDNVGSMTFYFDPNVNHHRSFVKQIMAEKAVEKYVPGKGTFVVFEAVGRQNHKLDCAYMACVAGHMAGVRLLIDGGAPDAQAKAAEGWMSARNRKTKRSR